MEQVVGKFMDTRIGDKTDHIIEGSGVPAHERV